MKDWISVGDRLPDEDKLVKTLVRDNSGIHNEALLRRKGNLWFLPDHSMYIYYTPTHWKPL